VTRRLRVRLLGNGWQTFGGAAIPDDRIIELSEEEAAAFLKDRRSARRVEVLGWVERESTDVEPRSS
jgi:hypothetical protein